MRRWLIPALVLIAAAAGAGWYWWTQAPGIVRQLPAGQTVAYVNLQPLRRARLFAAGAAVRRGPAYAAFVQASGFDFERDLDAIAVAMQGPPLRPRDATAILQGRFGPKFTAYLRQHARSHGKIDGADAYIFPGWARPRQLLTIVPLSGGRLLVTNAADAAPIVRRARRWWNFGLAAPRLWQPGGGWRTLIAYAGVNTQELAAERALDGSQPPLEGLQRIAVRLRGGADGLTLSAEAPADSSADAAASARWIQSLVGALGTSGATPLPELAASLEHLRVGQKNQTVQLRWPLDAASLRQWWQQLWMHAAPQARPAFAGGSAPDAALRSAPLRPRKDRPSGAAGQRFSPATEWDLGGTPFLGLDLAPAESTRSSPRAGTDDARP